MLISIDHGNKQVKTIHHAPFTSGLVCSEVRPFGGETLAYQGRYYTLTDQRIPYRRDKTEDERFFVWGDRIFEKCGIRRDEEGDGGKTLEIRGKRRLSARDGGANYQQS